MVNQGLRRDFLRRIYELGIFKDITKSPNGEGFYLNQHESEPSAPLSPLYLEYRLLQSDYFAKLMAVQLFKQTAEELKERPHQLAPIPEGIVPVVSTLSDQMRIPMVTPRGSKSHGSGSHVDGLWEWGTTALLFDDVITSGKSALDAQVVMKEANLFVTDIIVLTDRQQGAKVRLKQAGLELHSIFTLGEMLDTYLTEELISGKVFAQIEAYLASPCTTCGSIMERRGNVWKCTNCGSTVACS